MDRSDKMFLFMVFVKQDGSFGLSDKESFTAKTCIYKNNEDLYLFLNAI
jgi:hypothetical protein